MGYTSIKLLTTFAITAISAASLSAATLVEFTFDNAGSDIDERAGWEPAGGASLDSRVIMAQNESALFNSTVGLTIAPLISIAPPPISLEIGMDQINTPNAFAGQTNPAGTPPTDQSQAVIQAAAIGQFSIVNDLTPAPPVAPIGWQIVPESIRITGTGSNLDGILLRDNDGDIQFISTSSPNGPLDMTFDLSNRDVISFGGPVNYTLFLIGSGGSPAGLSFASADGDFIQYEGQVVPIPEPSVYMAGATILMLGGFLYIRRRKAAKQDKEATA